MENNDQRLAVGIVFILWGALNVRTGKVFNWLGKSDNGPADEPWLQFVTRAKHPEKFWLMESYKFVAGTGMLLILGEEHWKR